MPAMDEELIRRDLAVLWHPCSQMRDYQDFAPLPVVRASGCHLELSDGRRLIDGISSWWCKSLGHAHPRLVTALQRQAECFDQVILANTTNAPVVRFCERLLAWANGADQSQWGPTAGPGRLPGHFGKVFLGDNGSTGVEIAVKMALHAQQHRGEAQRRRFAALQAGYHGETVATLALGDCGLYGDPYRSLMFPVTMLTDLPLRSGPAAFDWLDASDAWPGIEAQLAPLADELAAIVYEPVLQGAGGMRVYSPDLLTRLRAWADAHGVFLIADEIAAGMGRCGAPLAGHLAPDAQPDFAVVSKGLTGGMLPLSAVLLPDAIYDLFLADYTELKAFMHSNTYTGNGLAIAVANAVFDTMAEEAVLDQVAQRGPLLARGLAGLQAERPYLANLRGIGMMAAVDITGFAWQQRTGFQVYQACIERGVLLRNLGDTMYLFPPLNTPATTIEEMVGILGEALDAVVR